MNNPEDQNPMLPNLRDECLSGMNSVVKGIVISFAICVAAIIAWFFFLVTRPAKVVEEWKTASMNWNGGSFSNVVVYPDDAVSHVVVMSNRFYPSVEYYAPEVVFVTVTNETPQHFLSIHDMDGETWLWSSVYTNNWHWTNVVFSSTREPVVTKTNGEWRIGFK